MTPEIPVLVDLVSEDSRWDDLNLNQIADRAARTVLTDFELETDDFEISLLACSDARIRELNAGFRGKDQPTNVLSWPATDLAPATPGGQPAQPPLGFLGDIAIAFETTAKEAATAGLDLEAHVTHLLVHATLHLLGYDHETDTDATLMEGLEIKALARLGLGNPYSNDNNDDDAE